MSDTKNSSLKDLRAMHERGEVEAPRKDAPEQDMPDGFWEKAVPVEPKAKKPVSLRVDTDILEFFKGQGEGHLTRMHGVLRAYVDAKTKGHTPS